MLLIAAAGLSGVGCAPPPASPPTALPQPVRLLYSAPPEKVAGPSVAPAVRTYRPGYAASAARPPPELEGALRDFGARDMQCPRDRVQVGYVWGSHLLADGCGRRAVYMKDGDEIYLLSIVPLNGEPPPP